MSTLTTDHPPVSMNLWSRDHWSTLLYIESRAVDYRGSLDPDRMRSRSDRHPVYLGKYKRLSALPPMDYPTRLNDGTTLRGHDDWDCVKDMMAAGLVEEKGGETGKQEALNMVSLPTKLTPLGWDLAHQLRRHVAGGGNTANFRPVVLDLEGTL